MDIVRTVIVWIIGLIITSSSNRKWESLDWRNNLLKFIGYIILVLGNLIYNKILILNFELELEKKDLI